MYISYSMQAMTVEFLGPGSVCVHELSTPTKEFCTWLCSVLQCVAVCCSVLQFVALCCSVLFVCTSFLHPQKSSTLYVALQCAAVCCSVLQCVAVCFRVFPCVAGCCSVFLCVAVCCNVLRCFAVCCSVLQCFAVCCMDNERTRVYSFAVTSRRALFTSAINLLESVATVLLQFVAVLLQCVAVKRELCPQSNTLQHTATHCTLRHTTKHLRTATHCNTLQHTATHRNTPEAIIHICKRGHAHFSNETFCPQNGSSHLPNKHTRWRRIIECLIFIDRFLQKSPIISDSFAENDL